MGALDTLKALASNKPAGSGSNPLVHGLDDPAIKGAKKNKNTVQLGLDPDFTEKAAYSAELKAALDKAKADFEVYQAELRDYGAAKRQAYNKAFKTNVTTVEVPYVVEVPEDAESATPGRETKVVQVVCTNKYSVDQDSVMALKPDLGDTYDTLFQEEETKVLKPNAEALIRELLQEQGLQGEELENSMNILFETKVKVKTQTGYEQAIQKASEDVQTVLAQSVTRVSPGLKFPS